MKSALGYAAVAALIALGVFAYRGDLGGLIGGETGKAVQETADKAKQVTKEKVVEAAAVAKEKLAKAKDVTVKKVAEATEVAKEKMAEAKDAAVKVKDAAVEKVREVRQAATSITPDPTQPGSETAEKKSPAKEGSASEKPGVIEKAVDAVKTAASKTVPSPIEWPVVSEEEFERQRQARLARVAKSSSLAATQDQNEAGADAAKNAPSPSKLSPVVAPDVSEDELERARQARLAAVANSSKSSAMSKEGADDAAKSAPSPSKLSPVVPSEVSDDELERARKARLARVAKSSKSSAKAKQKEATPSETEMAASTSGDDGGNGEETATSGAETPASGGDSAAALGTMTPVERVKASPEGSLKNPFDYKDPKIVAEGYKTYMKYSCNGCHGGGGGGGMCPPLTNETWVYGGDDDTLFRLITVGSDGLGRSRKGQETVVGPMPPYEEIIKDEEQMWKIIAYIRSKWGGREHKIEW